jgi:hypothetical protein
LTVGDVTYSPHLKVSPSPLAANLQGHFQQRPVLATASLSSFVDLQQLPLRKLLSLVEQIVEQKTVLGSWQRWHVWRMEVVRHDRAVVADLLPYFGRGIETAALSRS